MTKSKYICRLRVIINSVIIDQNTPNPSPEQAIDALQTAVAESITLDDHKAELAKLSDSDVRPKVAETLEICGAQSAAKAPAIRIVKSGEIRKLAESLRLEEDYVRETEKQRAFQLLKNGEKMPDFGQVMKAFTPEMLIQAQQFQSSRLVLSTRGRSFDDLVAAMDMHKIMPDQNDTYVNELYRCHSSQRPENWGAYIVEDTKEMDVHDFDDIKLTLGERLDIFSSYKKTAGVNGINRFKYAQLTMQALKSGKPVDAETWTMFDEDIALSASLLPGADWGYIRREVGFFWVRPGRQSGRARLRRSVGGDVLLP